jgi:hypothetical protein
MEAPSQRALDSAAKRRGLPGEIDIADDPQARSAALSGTFEPARSAQVSDGLHR